MKIIKANVVFVIIIGAISVGLVGIAFFGGVLASGLEQFFHDGWEAVR